MSLQPITSQTAYLPGANNLGVIRAGTDGAIVIDTGIDKDTGRALRKALEQAGLTLHAIISTHHHADHIGGNDYLIRNLPGVVIYAPHHEAPLIEHPLLEPIYLHNGAHPWSALQTKWLMARGSPVDHRIDTGMLTIANVELEILPLAGHSLAQIGIAVDGVCFAADGFFGTDVLQKHGIPYAHDIKAQIDSLERLAQRREHFFLPGHGPLTPRAALAETISANRHAIETTTRIVLAALAEPADLASIARRVRHAAGYTFAGIPQYAIFTSVIAAYLSYLEAGGQAGATLTDAGIIWRRLSAYTQ